MATPRALREPAPAHHLAGDILVPDFPDLQLYESVVNQNGFADCGRTVDTNRRNTHSILSADHVLAGQRNRLSPFQRERPRA